MVVSVGLPERVALGHEFETDVLGLHFLLPPPPGLDSEALSFSIVYALVEGAARYLMPHPPERDHGPRRMLGSVARYPERKSAGTYMLTGNEYMTSERLIHNGQFIGTCRAGVLAPSPHPVHRYRYSMSRWVSMDRRVIVALNWHWVLSDVHRYSKFGLPLGSGLDWLGREAEILLRLRGSNKELILDPEARIALHKGIYYLRSERLDELQANDQIDYVYVVIHGSDTSARIVLDIDDGCLLDILQAENPALRLHVYDLPPTTLTVVDTASVLRAILVALRRKDPGLHSDRTEEFVRYPHILLSLLSHVMELRSKDQIAFVSVLRVIADQLRELLKDRIVKLEKSHAKVWAHWYGRRVSFVDGGVARIESLPGSEPLAMRVGIYTVTPGETNPEVREEWKLEPYVAGDIVNTPADPDVDAPPPDPKRLLEAARYMLEALTVLKHAESTPPPDVVFLHGPLVNSFLMYDEGEPHFIPGVDPTFLQSHGITLQVVTETLRNIPRRRDGMAMWNQCMAVYGFLMRRLFELDVPIVGVVERSGSSAFRNTVIEYLVQAGGINQSYGRKLRQRLDKYRITDELLFGCILDEGEYIVPMQLEKNVVRRAREHWQGVVAQYPTPMATYLKTSDSSFPYRVELNCGKADPAIREVMALLYHTSRLLPEYAFPVGLDIADKYAKVPDWLSRGVSASIAAQVLAKAVRTGEPRVLQQLRRLLAQSPRDFFFRPRAK